MWQTSLKRATVVVAQANACGLPSVQVACVLTHGAGSSAVDHMHRCRSRVAPTAQANRHINTTLQSSTATQTAAGKQPKSQHLTRITQPTFRRCSIRRLGCGRCGLGCGLGGDGACVAVECVQLLPDVSSNQHRGCVLGQAGLQRHLLACGGYNTNMVEVSIASSCGCCRIKLPTAG